MKQRLVLILVFSLFFIFTAYLTRNTSLNYRFGDEVGHIVGGSLILQGKTPYNDIQYNHQPTVYYFAALVEKATHPQLIFHLVRRNREAIWLYSLIWNIVLVLVFGPAMIMFALIFEVYKYFNLGHALLSESLAIYPYIYLVGITLKLLFTKKKVLDWELFIASIAFYFTLFSLLPLWPVLSVVSLIITWKVRQSKKQFVWFILPCILLTLGLFSHISVFAWLRETVFYNLKYFIPSSQKNSDLVSIVQMIFPLLDNQYWGTTFTSRVFFLIFPLYLYGLKYLPKPRLNSSILLLTLLFFSNNRVRNLDDNNFHLLPLMGLLIFTPTFLWAHVNQGKDKLVPIVLLFTAFLGIALWSHPIVYKRNYEIDNYNQYSESETYGRIVQILANPKDKLLPIPNDPLTNWVANVPFATSVTEYYSWIFEIPQYRQQLDDTLKYEPPRFVIDTGLGNNISMERKVLATLKSKYYRVLYVGKPSKLYLLKTSIPLISPEKKAIMETLSFSL